MGVYLTWQFWYQVLSAFAFGIASSLVPVLNSELFIVGALGSQLLGPLEVALGLALGHGVGKQIMFVGIRKGSESRGSSTKSPSQSRKDPGGGGCVNGMTRPHISSRPRDGECHY